MPPSGRANDPTSAPVNASEIVTSGNCDFSSVGKAAANPMNEPKVPM